MSLARLATGKPCMRRLSPASAPAAAASRHFSLAVPRAAAVRRTGAKDNKPAGTLAAKVQALPFKLDPYSARHRATMTVLASRSPPLLGRLAVVWYAISAAVRSLFRRNRDEEEEATPKKSKVEMEKFAAVYLPYWVVDGSVTIPATGSEGTSPCEATFMIDAATVPGFNWAPVQTLPAQVSSITENTNFEEKVNEDLVQQGLDPDPSIRVFGAKEEPEFRIFESDMLNLHNTMSNRDFDAFEDPRNLTPEERRHVMWKSIYGPEWGTKWYDARVSLVPFTVSPLLFLDVLRSTRQFTLNLPDDLRQVARKLSRGKGVPAGKETARMTLDGSKAEVDFVAAYPVLLPWYILKMKAAGEQFKPVNIAVQAWGPNLDVPMMYVSGEQLIPIKYNKWAPASTWIGLEHQTALSMLNPAFFPCVPHPSSIADQERSFQKTDTMHELDEEAEKLAGDYSDEASEQRKRIREQYHEIKQDAFADKSQEEMHVQFVEQEIIRERLQGRVQEVLENADWEKLQQTQREKTEKSEEQAKRKAAKGPREARVAEEQIPHDRSKGLGRYIEWTDPRIQRYTDGRPQNEEYLQALAKHHTKRIEVSLDVLAFGDSLYYNAKNSFAPSRTPRDVLMQNRADKVKAMPPWLAHYKAQTTPTPASKFATRGVVPPLPRKTRS